MTQSDSVLEGLSKLPVLPPSGSVSARIKTMTSRRLAPRPLNPLWAVAIAGSALCYLAWALQFVSALVRHG